MPPNSSLGPAIWTVASAFSVTCGPYDALLPARVARGSVHKGHARHQINSVTLRVCVPNPLFLCIFWLAVVIVMSHIRFPGCRYCHGPYSCRYCQDPFFLSQLHAGFEKAGDVRIISLGMKTWSFSAMDDLASKGRSNRPLHYLPQPKLDFDGGYT